MTGRILAVCGWLAWQVGKPFRTLRLGRVANSAVLGIVALLVVAAAVPIVLPLLDPQPEDVVVEQIIAGTIEHPDRWVRLRGRLQPLEESPTDDPGEYGLLIDAQNPMRSVVVEGSNSLPAAASTVVTGIVEERFAKVDEEIPIEATVAGTPPTVYPHAVVRLDPVTKPERVVAWWLAIPPALLAVLLFIGARVGYPIFRPTNEIAVLTSPLAPGERIPSAYAGRIGTSERPLIDPGGALLLVRRGPSGTLLTAQPLADDGGVAPQPTLIGGSWTSGRVGDVHTISETVPALLVRSELVDATFLFARSSERDRVAAHVAVER